MHTASALPGVRQVLALDHMQLGRQTALAHREHVNLRRRIGRRIVAHSAHVHHLGQHPLGAREIGHVEHDRTDPTDLML